MTFENYNTHPFVHVHRSSTEANTYPVHPNRIDIFLPPYSGCRATRVYFSDTGHLWMHAVIFLEVYNKVPNLCQCSKTLVVYENYIANYLNLKNLDMNGGEMTGN